MNICKCMNCQDKGVITIRNHTEYGTVIKYRKEWCTCQKGKYLKKESQKDVYDC